LGFELHYNLYPHNEEEEEEEEEEEAS